MKHSAQKQTHVQHSKKLTNWAMLQWVVISVIVIISLSFASWTESETEVISGVVTWSASLAGIVCTGYMGNSSIEKYADRKFTVDETFEENG